MCSFNHKVYDSFMAPIERNRLQQKRKLLLEEVAGDVLEIGFGTGANVKQYSYEQLDSLTLVDQQLPDYIDLRPVPKKLPVEVIKGDVMWLPFEDEQFDSVVFTLLFCTVEDPAKGFEEIRRVLKPEGRIYFIEHVEPVEQPYKYLFNKLTPAWRRIAHGCTLNRDTVHAIQRAGFTLVEYHRFYRSSFVSGVAAKV